jgi:four helix bundle protein
MATITRFEEIEAWQLGRELTRLVYSWSNSGKFARDFGLRDQIRRAAVSIISNIAEGFESKTQALFIDLLGRAKGSAGELRAQLYVALDQGYITQAQFDQGYKLAKRTAGKIYGLMQYLVTQPNARRVREQALEYVMAV